MATGATVEHIWDLAREQFSLFMELGAQAEVPSEGQRSLLSLSAGEWADWTSFLSDGPPPPCADLPQLLLRLGEAAYRFAAGTEDDVPIDALAW